MADTDPPTRERSILTRRDGTEITIIAERRLSDIVRHEGIIYEYRGSDDRRGTWARFYFERDVDNIRVTEIVEDEG